jgi:hypothetical protein
VFWFLVAVALSIPRAHGSTRSEPQVTCGITTVAYRFAGTPGQAFDYDGETFRIPRDGSITLIAVKGLSSYRVSTHDLPLDVWPLDEFGMRTVPLPSDNERRTP